MKRVSSFPTFSYCFASLDQIYSTPQGYYTLFGMALGTRSCFEDSLDDSLTNYFIKGFQSRPQYATSIRSYFEKTLKVLSKSEKITINPI